MPFCLKNYFKHWTSKWEIQLEKAPKWDRIFQKPVLSKANAFVEYFIYQDMHQTLLPKNKLLIFNLVNADACDYCGYCDDISHRLFYFGKSKKIWDEVDNWLKIIMLKIQCTLI